jgi:hypothetical protein
MAQHDCDLNSMKEAIDWAKDCNPKVPNIPKVGAIITASNLAIGRGRRGNGEEGESLSTANHGSLQVKYSSTPARLGARQSNW